MSGPIAVSYSLSSSALSFSATPLGAVYLAAEAIRQAEAMGQEYDAALASMNARAEQLAEKQRAQQQAQILHRAAVQAETQRLAGRLERLQGIAASLAERHPEQADTLSSPALPQSIGDDLDSQLRHAETLRAETSRLEALLDKAGAALDAQLRATLSTALQAPAQPGLDDLLHAYAVQRALQPGLNQQESAVFRQTVERVLARLELTPGAAVPLELESLARDIFLAPSTERAEALALELRLRVQRYQEEQQRLHSETETMQTWLAALPAEAPAALRTALEIAAAGLRRLTPEQREETQAILEAVRRAHLRQEQQAAALVLQQSLRDLGYEVEDIASTLFVEGGVVHFQRQGWEDYHVRLRLDPRENTVNFNVVRPRGMEESAVRKRQDFLAEERWCAEFPKLQQTLAARGIAFKILRQLGAGELPVQTVDPASLPKRREEEALRKAEKKTLRV